MAVKIHGLTLLDSNIYDRILLTGSESGYRIYIQKNDVQRLPGVHVGSCFSEEIKGQSDEQKIISIVDKFLEYVNISMLTKDYQAYNKIYEVARGSRELAFKTEGPMLEIIKQKVFQKYINDRLKFCFENRNINFITLSLEDKSSYAKDKKSKRMHLELLTNNSKLIEFEKEFLRYFIFNRLHEIGECATIQQRTHLTSVFISKEEFAQYYIICGDLRIVLGSDRTLINEVSEIVAIYNQQIRKQNLEQSKRIQLKMEGF